MNKTSQVIKSPMHGIVSKLLVEIGVVVKKGDPLVILEAMKMESVVSATTNGIVKRISIKEGEVVQAEQELIQLKAIVADNVTIETQIKKQASSIRADLQELQKRKTFTQDEFRPEAVAKRRKKNKRTARENIADLCADNSFLEYGSLIVAAQRSRRSEEDLIQNTPADGIVTGIGNVNANFFDEASSKCMILHYDYTVLAGTQGMFGHKKTDRVLDVALRAKLPIILFAEGGGGRPGDIDFQGVGGLDVVSFVSFAKMNGVAPRVAIVSGYCFAGNAALAGCADVIIATKDVSIGMGGPAMIEGGGLGKYHPKEVGPAEIQAANGVLDIVVADEIEAVLAAKKYISYFQGSIKEWDCVEQKELRDLIPENRRRVYDVRKIITSLADKESVLELRKDFAQGMITALIRVEGKAIGLIANNPKHLGGAIDADGADKASRFMQLCDVFGLPILSLCDTPGFMVGPKAETTGLVRHTARMFTVAAKLTVPFFTIVLRKAYGLGSMAMAGGGMHAPFFTVSWPTGEFGGMGLEGAVRLGFRKELEKIKDPIEREATFNRMVEKAYQHGKAINTAAYLEIDEVIDPSESRKWIVNGLLSNPTKNYKDLNHGRFVDTW